ncbi:MAG: hypothetical protein HY073_01370 [Deltaproteobacteria bacterium]|nr:hypothetical protein [Deltaproteobacteria bacterium]
MINTIILIWGFIPMAVGLGFFFRPKKMVAAQTRFRKKAEKFEKRLYKAHRSTGLGFILVSLVFLLSAFHPVWIYNCFVVGRIITGVFFPSLFHPTMTLVKVTTPTVWL